MSHIYVVFFLYFSSYINFGMQSRYKTKAVNTLNFLAEPTPKYPLIYKCSAITDKNNEINLINI